MKLRKLDEDFGLAESKIPVKPKKKHETKIMTQLINMLVLFYVSIYSAHLW